MAQDLPIDPSLPRAARLHQLLPALEGLLTGESSGIANLANVASVLWSATGWHWVGFYLVDQAADNLVLGPFQGPVACTRLHRGKGVCAAAWETNATQVVPDVHEFPGHVACSSASLVKWCCPSAGPTAWWWRCWTSTALWPTIFLRKRWKAWRR